MGEKTALPLRAMIGGIVSSTVLILGAPFAIRVSQGATPAAGATLYIIGLLGTAIGFALATILPFALWHGLRARSADVLQWSVAGMWGGVVAALASSGLFVGGMLLTGTEQAEMMFFVPLLLLFGMSVAGALIGALARPLAHFYARNVSVVDA